MPIHKTPILQNKVQAFAYQYLSKKDLFEMLKDAAMQTSPNITDDDCFIQAIINGFICLRTSDDEGIKKKIEKAKKDAEIHK